MKTFLLVLLGLVAGGVALLVLLPEQDYAEEELRSLGFTAFPQPQAVPEFQLQDAAGGAFDTERLRGRWSLLFFGYANCPDICPLTMSELGKAEDLLLEGGDETFQGILVTVDPERDSPEALRAYVGAFSDHFVGVTGGVAAIGAFARSLHAGFSKQAPAADGHTEAGDAGSGYLMDHSSHLAVVSPDVRHVGYLRAPFDARQIATLVRALGRRPTD